MYKDKTTAILGDEHDQALREALRAVLLQNGATRAGHDWHVGGSQEVEIAVFKLGDEAVTVEAETFVGLTLTGPKAVVEGIALQVRQRLSA